MVHPCGAGMGVWGKWTAFEFPCPAQPLRDPFSLDSPMAANSRGIR